MMRYLENTTLNAIKKFRMNSVRMHIITHATSRKY